MLISQRIATDPKFLRVSLADSLALIDGSVSSFRRKIMMSTKVIVPVEIMSVGSEYGEQMGLLFGKNWQDTEEGSVVDRKIDQYLDFAKMPFDSLLFENGTGALFVRKESHLPEYEGDTPVVITHITHTGFVSPVHVVAMFDNTGGSSITHCVMVAEELRPCVTAIYTKDIERRYPGASLELQQELIKEVRDAFQQMTLYTVLEVLLFMNVRNIEQVIYRLNRRERLKIQKSILPFYEYRILNIYRERREYKSLEVLADQFNRTKCESINRRAHLVRGHFKRIRGKLFWWNPFMRNAKNITTAGVVEKDYHLKN